MGASFHIHRDRGREAWIVVEEKRREIGGLFATLVAALDFVDAESRRFEEARAVIELSPRAHPSAGSREARARTDMRRLALAGGR